MITMRPAAPTILARVTHDEFCRLIGWPPSRPMSEELQSGVAQVRAWYAEQGTPWVGAKRHAVMGIRDGEVQLDGGIALHSAALATLAHEHEVTAVYVAAITAGREVADEAQRHWREGRPDEGYLLDRLGAAVAESLARWSAVALCQEAGRQGETVLLHHSPGCGAWPLDDQFQLLEALAEPGARDIGPVHVLDSGGLEPVHSLLAVFPVTSFHVPALDARDACRRCDLSPCRFRRAPFQSGT